MEDLQYGFETDEVKQSSLVFGLNKGEVYLTKFEWIQNGGKDGAEQEAVDIIFDINGTPKSHRMFPITKAYVKGGGETSDPDSKEMKDTYKNFNATLFHIMHCFTDEATYKAAISKKFDPDNKFKEFITAISNLLPKNFASKPLDIFLHYQWQPSEGQTRTYLEIPKKVSYGYWIVPAQAGEFEKKIVPDPSDEVREALYYINKEGIKHPFVRNGWFMNNPFGKQLNPEREDSTTNNSATPTSAPTIPTEAASVAESKQEANHNIASAATQTW